MEYLLPRNTQFFIHILYGKESMLAPVQQAEREKIMDVLRGFALLGIFIANLHILSLYSARFKTGPFIIRTTIQ